MEVKKILDEIDRGVIGLPVFQRGYVWNRSQVRSLMESLYMGHPVGSLLIWSTMLGPGTRGDDGTRESVPVDLLLDGQQRITSLYGIIRGEPPKFFDGDARALTGLHFNVETEEFAFYTAARAKNPLWISVTKLIKEGVGPSANPFIGHPQYPQIINRLARVCKIQDKAFYIEKVTGPENTIDVVVDIFNRVNGSGTKLSHADLALAKVCSTWPGYRNKMRMLLDGWSDQGYRFTGDFLLRTVNAIVNGVATWKHLHKNDAEVLQAGLDLAGEYVSKALEAISSRLGLDNDRVLFGRYAITVLARWLYLQKGNWGPSNGRDLLLSWYLNCGLWGRYTGPGEGRLNKDYKALEAEDGGIYALIKLLEDSLAYGGDLTIKPDHFEGRGFGARGYPMMYTMALVDGALDFEYDVPLFHIKSRKVDSIELHSIFPKQLLSKGGYSAASSNTIANWCFLPKSYSTMVGSSSPQDYLTEVSSKALSSQWIPQDRALWRVKNYEQFLQARRELLAAAANRFLKVLAEGGLPEPTFKGLTSGIRDEAEWITAYDLDEWVAANGLQRGELQWELINPQTSLPLAVFDLAWPDGLQQGFTQPVAVLLNENAATHQIANDNGFRYFTSVDEFKEYVVADVLSPLDTQSLNRHFPELLDSPMGPLFREFRRKVLRLDSHVSEDVLEECIAYSKDANFTNIVPTESRLYIYLNIPDSEIQDPHGACKVPSGQKQRVLGTILLRHSKREGSDYALDLVQQALEYEQGAAIAVGVG